jgi:mannose/fructose-specific phosphotransferase system component IIA
VYYQVTYYSSQAKRYAWINIALHYSLVLTDIYGGTMFSI